jgi:hypothetical protein
VTHTEAVLGHLGLNVPDLGVARSYYDELMPLVGFEPFFAADDEFSYKPADNLLGTYLFSTSRHRRAATRRTGPAYSTSRSWFGAARWSTAFMIIS